MNVKMLRKYVWLIFAILLPMGFVACSESDDPVHQVTPPLDKDEEGDGGEDVDVPEHYTFVEAYINQFCYDQMAYYYLWWKDIDTKNWKLNDDPIKKVKEIRYQEDRWTQVIENIKPYTDTSTTTTGTYGYDFVLYWATSAKKNLYAVVTMVYPGSPAEKAGLKRGSIIMQNNGKDIANTNSDINALISSASLNLTVALSVDEINSPTIVKMTPKDMYLDPVLYEKVFDCGGKKVGYVFFNDFTMNCNDRLIEVAKAFKQEGVSELILDLRYNGGGYVVTEELLASLLAPAASVEAGELYQTAVYNGTPYSQAMEQYYGKDFANTYLKTKHEWKSDGKTYSYDTSDANIGISKIYALVTESTASASEAILVSMMPFMDVEIIGTQTTGKHCSGVMFEAEEYYQDNEDYGKKLKKENPKAYQEFVDEYSAWKQYVGNWGVYVMINTYADKNGNNACRPSGLVPDAELEDNPQEPYALGDDREVLLHEALTRAGYQDFTVESKSASRHASMELGRSIQWKSNEGLRILPKPERPAPVPTSPLRMK